MGKGQASSACSEAIAGQELEATGPGAPGTPTPTQKAHVGTGVRAEGAGGNGGNGSLRSAHSSLTSRKTWCFHSTVWKVEENAEFNWEESMPKGSQFQAALPQPRGECWGGSHLTWPDRRCGLAGGRVPPGRHGGPLGPPRLSGVFPRAAGCPGRPAHRPAAEITCSWACFISGEGH